MKYILILSLVGLIGCCNSNTKVFEIQSSNRCDDVIALRCSAKTEYRCVLLGYGTLFRSHDMNEVNKVCQDYRTGKLTVGN